MVKHHRTVRTLPTCDPVKVRRALSHLEKAKHLLADGGARHAADVARTAAESAKSSLRSLKGRYLTTHAGG